MNPTIASGLITGGASLLSGALGGLFGSAVSDNQARANAENMRLNRELLAFQKYQYEDQKRYNSMTEQVRRMRAAGLNPALLLQNGTTGSVGSAVGSPSFQPYEAPDLSPIGSVVNGLSSSASSLASVFSQSLLNEKQGANLDQDTANKAIENANLAEYWKKKIANLSEDTKYKTASITNLRQLTRIANLERQFAEQTLDFRVKESQIKMASAFVDFRAKQISTAFLPQQIQSEIAQKIASAKMLVMTGQASVKQATAAVMDAVTRRQQNDAQFGMNEEDRANFFNATMNLMHSKVGALNSEEFNNLGTPWGYSIGSKFFGQVSHQTTQYHTTDYNNWKSGKQGYRTKGKK